jgi:hypothetical protein
MLKLDSGLRRNDEQNIPRFDSKLSFLICLRSSRKKTWG